MTLLLSPEDLAEIDAVLEEGGLLGDPTFTTVAISEVPALVPKRSLSANPKIAAREDLKMVAGHGDPVLLYKWLNVARTQLEGNEALVARLSTVIERTVGERDPDGKRSAWTPSALVKLVDRLADLYPREADQRRVVLEAQLEAKEIAFDAAAKNSWTAIIEHAKGRNVVDRVLDVALAEFETDDVLLAHRATRGVIDTAITPTAPAAPAATTRRRIP